MPGGARRVARNGSLSRRGHSIGGGWLGIRNKKMKMERQNARGCGADHSTPDSALLNCESGKEGSHEAATINGIETNAAVGNPPRPGGKYGAGRGCRAGIVQC